MKKIIIFIIALLLIAGGVVFWMKTSQKNGDDSLRIDELLAPLAAADFYEESNKLVVNQGSATVKRSTGEEETVETETTVEMGDTIIVNDDSMATIYWFDDSVSRLQAGTELAIDKASYNPENITETDINLNIIKGEVWSKVKNLVDEESEFLSYSGNVVAGVRGSVYNMIVNDEGIVVESIEHAAMVGEIDQETREISKQTFITHGKQAKTNDPKSIEIDKIPEERFGHEWFKENIAGDKKIGKLLQQKNLERIQKQAGLLPGEKGYERKMRLIQKRLDEIQNPAKQAELQVRIAQMRASEGIALMLKNREGNAKDIARHINGALQTIETSDLPKEIRQKLKSQLQIEMKALDRTMENILPDNEQLYGIKEMIREQRIGLETDPKKQERVRKKVMEQKLFELIDAIKEGKIKPEKLKGVFRKLRSSMEGREDMLESWEDFRNIAVQMLSDLEGMEGLDIDLAELEELKKFFGSEKFERVAREAQEELLRLQEQAQAELDRLKRLAEEVATPPPPPPPEDMPEEDPGLVREEAPFYAGPSNV